MKLTASGVTFSAAMTRSPSFSRSASSTTTTMPPLAMTARASATGAKGVRSATVAHLRDRSPVDSGQRPGNEQPFDVLGYHVHLQVHTVSHPQHSEGRHR